MPVLNLVDRAFGRAMGRDRKLDVPSGLKLPPLLSGGLPILGHASEFVSGAIELLFRAHREHGELAGLNVFHRKMVAVFADCQIIGWAVTWYMVAGAVALGLFVSYAAMFGFDKLREALEQITNWGKDKTE